MSAVATATSSSSAFPVFGDSEATDPPTLALTLVTTENLEGGEVRERRYTLAADKRLDAASLVLTESAPDDDPDRRLRASRTFLWKALLDDDGAVSAAVEPRRSTETGRWVLMWADGGPTDPIDDVPDFDSRQAADTYADEHATSRRRLFLVLSSETEMVRLEHLEDLVAEVISAAAATRRGRRRAR